jgi:hypothetical protein
MQRVTRSSAVATMPARPASLGAPGYFTPGNPAVGQPATTPGYEWFNAVQEELEAAIVGAGITLDADNLVQLRTAMRRLSGANVTNVTATTTLTVDAAGIVNVAVAAAATITLPAANAAGGRPYRLTFVRSDTTANLVTVQRAGADLIEGLTNFPLVIGGRLTLVSDGTGNWRLADGQAALSGAQSFQSNGTFVVPANVFRVRARLWGSGGGGGGAGASGAAGGGASGAHAFGIFAVTPGQSIPITVGGAGVGGDAGANNGTGGGSVSFGALASADGGGGGLGAASGFGGPGSSGSASGGALNLNGQPGGSGIQFGTSFVGGLGGAPIMAGASSLLSTSVGTTGFFPGGGGGGGANNNPGGAGAPGLILVEW